MNNPLFSQSAIFRLQQLASAVHKHKGVRHKLSDPTSMMTLLRYASQAPTPEIALQYQAFVRVLTREERGSLQQRGIAVEPANATWNDRAAI